MSRSSFCWSVAVAGFALVFGWAASGFSYSYVRSCGPTWSQQPAPYKINNQGSADVGFSQTKSVVLKSYKAWSDPCCSTFKAKYQGKTSKTAIDSRQSRSLPPIHSWVEKSSNWPSYLGSPNSGVLGVTMTSFSGCTIVNAPILYNGVRYSFGPGGSADLQSIATHEIGHYLGLDHTQASGATMSARYTGGTGFRTLEQDDINGVCSLYGGGTCTCSSDSDCASGEKCDSSGKCVDKPCKSDADCSGSKECDTSTGNCRVPPCSSDADCTRSGYVCDTSQGTCVPKCRVCKSCQSTSDCGSSQNWACVNVGSGNACVTLCSGGCPGDSQCTQVQTRRGTISICLNPGACLSEAKTVCPSQYNCGSSGQVVKNCKIQTNNGDDTGTTTGDDTGTNDDAGISLPDASTSDGGGTGGTTTADGSGGSSACPSLGRACAPNCASNCGSEADGKLTTESGTTICSCRCSTDADCGPNGTCQTYGGEQWCAPTANVDAGSGSDIVIKDPTSQVQSGCTCGLGGSSTPALPAMLLFAVGFLALRRRGE